MSDSARDFRVPWLAELARWADREYGPVFEQRRATIHVSPVRFPHLVEVGDGICLDVVPHDTEAWKWWREGDSVYEVARRRRFSNRWREVASRQEIEAWLKSEVDRYLNELQADPAALQDSDLA